MKVINDRHSPVTIFNTDIYNGPRTSSRLRALAERKRNPHRNYKKATRSSCNRVNKSNTYSTPPGGTPIHKVNPYQKHKYNCDCCLCKAKRHLLSDWIPKGYARGYKKNSVDS